MRVNVRSASPGVMAVLVIIKVLIVIMSIFSFIGFCLLRTAGVEYFKEWKARRKNTIPVTAVVKEVEREFDKDTVRGYQIVSYEYNGEDYVSRVEAYIEAISKRSSNKDNEETDNDYSDKSDEHWTKLQESVGTEEKLYVDPDVPENAVHLADDTVVHALGLMTLFGILSFVLLFILIAALIVIGKKIIKKGKEELF